MKDKRERLLAASTGVHGASKVVSDNFTIAKAISIVVIVMGHYFGGIWWIPSTVGLFIFGFSSGYFTASKYNGDYEKSAFWINKAVRLMPHLLIIDLFLLILFLLRRKSGIMTWDTLLGLLGMNGFLDWFHVANASPFGAGLWFFTVLILFYLAYPALEIANRSRFIAQLFIASAFVELFILHYAAPMNHMLWMTVFAFVFGVYIENYRVRIKPIITILLGVAALVIMLILNYFIKYPVLNYILLMAASFSAVLFLIETQLSLRVPMKIPLLVSGCLLEIYFIHTYLMIKNNVYPGLIEFAASLGIILFVALLLQFVGNRLRNMIFSRS